MSKGAYIYHRGRNYHNKWHTSILKFVKCWVKFKLLITCTYTFMSQKSMLSLLCSYDPSSSSLMLEYYEENLYIEYLICLEIASLNIF